MFNPTYIQRSRHGVFYFRWVLPRCPKSAGSRSCIKLSLRTREPRQALRLAMPLSYLARRITEKGQQSRMDHKELRDLLREHFNRFLSTRKAAIDSSGPLSAADRELMQTTIHIAEMELADGPVNVVDDDRRALEFAKLYAVPLEAGTPLFETFKQTFRQAHRDYAKALLAYSDDTERFDFTPDEQRISTPSAEMQDSVTLERLVAEFWKVAQRENRWTGKTEGERREHIELLYERLGKDTPIASIGRVQANDMRTVLMSYPTNRHKARATRGKPLADILDMPGVKKLHPLTINKYLHSYNGLFNWAKRSGHCTDNPFEGLSLRTEKVNVQPPRVRFSDDQLQIIRQAVLAQTGTQREQHKWGTLIAIYSGARLNEIAQLHLDDVHQIDGIWCFDINQKPGTLKKLKNAASQRLVPIHPCLIEYGFLDYLERTKAIRGNDRLFPRFTYSKSDGYGRNLGRWVNESLLPDLNIKTKQLTFHSFRHTMVSKLFAAEVPEGHVMAIVGHEPGTTTLSTYNRSGFPMRLLLSALEKVL